MSKTKNIVVLTSRDNFIWTSMQEIIPEIEKTWEVLCHENNYNFCLVNVDLLSPKKNLHNIISSDLIVVSCFNTKIAIYINTIREVLGIDTRIFFYLHGLATIALWPLLRFDILHLMKSSDLFLGTCEGDLRSMKLAYNNASVKIIPFSISNLQEDTVENQTKKPFVFIGRISPQKNLDLLIKAYAQLENDIKKNHPLIFYGTEDHLGFPNIGIEEKSYGEKLKILVRELSIEKYVTFRGFVDRLKIQQELGRNYIFVSPSTHSDENFGMAAFRALSTGVTCILSDWGGHKEFKKDFPMQIIFLTPYITPARPIVNITELKISLIQSLKHQNDFIAPEYPENFSTHSICQKLKVELNTPATCIDTLDPTSLALTIFEQQKYFEEHNQIQKCFKSFEDPTFMLLFKAYAGQDI